LKKDTAVTITKTTIQNLLEAIPIVGSFFSVTFDAMQELRIKRLESFLKDLAANVNHIQNSLPDLTNLTDREKESLGALVEGILEHVERETQQEKRKYFQNFFITTLQNPNINDFDTRKYFLEIIAAMSCLECEILSWLSGQQKPIQIRDIDKPGVDPYAIYGAVNKLISHGFLETRRGSYMMNGQQDENLDNLVFTSTFGKQFVDYLKMSA
jgi:hypothetical protein